MKNNYEKIYEQILETISTNTIWRYTLSEVVFDLMASFDKYHWVGIYLLEKDVLYLETFLGKPTRHTSIPIHQGICGQVASEMETRIVGDVKTCDNYLSCSKDVKSEIVVPMLRNGSVLGVIDIDSDMRYAFTKDDRYFLEDVAYMLAVKAPILIKTE